MTDSEAHDVNVTHTPLDGPGFRAKGSIEGADVTFDYLRHILESTETNVDLTDAALRDPALRDLAMSVRAAHQSIESICFHLLDLHRGVADGNVNYPTDPAEGYPDH